MKNTKVSKVLLIFTFIISMLINLTPVYAANKKVKMPERAVDGSRILKSSRDYGNDTIIADTDGKYIYYIVNSRFSDSEYRMFKINIKTGKETGITKDEYIGLMVYKNVLLGIKWDRSLEKISKTGKAKRLALGDSLIGLGNSIYYIGTKQSVKKYRYGTHDLAYKDIGLYKMNVNGKRKKLIKKGIDGLLGISGKQLYYYNYYDMEWINIKTDKPENSYILSDSYDPISKTKFIYNYKEIKAGKYEKGKWKYKTVFKHNKGILSVCVCGGKLLALVSGEASGELYIMDLDGKNKTLLHKLQCYD